MTSVPRLPVSDNTKLSLFCKDDNTLFSGSSETTCLQGKPYIVDRDPYCRPIGEIVAFNKNSRTSHEISNIEISPPISQPSQSANQN